MDMFSTVGGWWWVIGIAHSGTSKRSKVQTQWCAGEETPAGLLKMSLTWECQQQLVRVRSAGLWLPFVDPFGGLSCDRRIRGDKIVNLLVTNSADCLFVCLFQGFLMVFFLGFWMARESAVKKPIMMPVVTASSLGRHPKLIARVKKS
jgi:hypothetical protein